MQIKFGRNMMCSQCTHPICVHAREQQKSAAVPGSESIAAHLHATSIKDLDEKDTMSTHASLPNPLDCEIQGASRPNVLIYYKVQCHAQTANWLHRRSIHTAIK